MNAYQDELERLHERLGMYPEDNLALLGEYHSLAAKARSERTEAAGRALLSIAYEIGERITGEEDLEPYYREAVEILQKFGPSEDYFDAINTLAWYLLQKDRCEESVPLFESIVRERAKCSDQVGYFPLRDLAVAYERINELQKALLIREQALETWKDVEIEGGTPDVAFYAEARTEMARLLSRLERHAEAEPHFRSVFDDSRRIYGSIHSYGRWHQTVIESVLDLASCLYRQNKVAAAMELIVQEMPDSFTELDEMGRMFAIIARQCYEQALKDLEAGKEPSSESQPSTIISRGFMSENN